MSNFTANFAEPFGVPNVPCEKFTMSPPTWKIAPSSSGNRQTSITAWSHLPRSSDNHHPIQPSSKSGGRNGNGRVSLPIPSTVDLKEKKKYKKEKSTTSRQQKISHPAGDVTSALCFCSATPEPEMLFTTKFGFPFNGPQGFSFFFSKRKTKIHVFNMRNGILQAGRRHGKPAVLDVNQASSPKYVIEPVALHEPCRVGMFSRCLRQITVPLRDRLNGWRILTGNATRSGSKQWAQR